MRMTKKKENKSSEEEDDDEEKTSHRSKMKMETTKKIAMKEGR